MSETKLYRIYTEDKNRSRIAGIVTAEFGSFTQIPAIGFWEGNQESSLVIEIITSKSRSAVNDVADRIKFVNKQEAILVTETEVKSELR